MAEGKCYKIDVCNDGFCKDECAIEVATSAIEKQIPKKVGKDGYGWNECTVCHNHGNNLLSNNFKWCPYCGQKLDWSEGETE